MIHLGNLEIGTYGKFAGSDFFCISQTWRSGLKMTRIRPEASRIRPKNPGSDQPPHRIGPDGQDRIRPTELRIRPTELRIRPTELRIRPRTARTCVPPAAASQIKVPEGQNTIPGLQNVVLDGVIDTPRLEGFPRKQHQFLAKAPGTRGFQTHQKTPLTPQNMNSSLQNQFWMVFCHLDLGLEAFEDHQRPFFFFARNSSSNHR